MQGRQTVGIYIDIAAGQGLGGVEVLRVCRTGDGRIIIESGDDAAGFHVATVLTGGLSGNIEVIRQIANVLRARSAS